MDAANSGNVALELEADPDAVAALRRRLGLGRARRFSLVWHDRDGVMAGRGIAVSTWQEGRAGGWRTEALVPGDAPWPIGAPPPLLGEATALTGLDVANGLGPVQRFEGQVRTGMAGAVSLRLVEGRIGAAPGLAVARLTVAGPAEAVAARSIHFGDSPR